ncbi:hypothetical protein [Alloprevotella tannerae]|uniref:DUF7666 domain-containing protein n=1 Tax=Alloprevotella tannerae TaxID=76122 RepID=UPI00288B62FD|nr:hypothetical protein [Alloprevotella tannerae]
MEKIKTYKGFDEKLRCRGFQYEVGKEYENSGDVECCARGFHACENPLEVFEYYAPAKSRFCEVEQSGVLKRENEGSKVASSKISIKCEIGLRGLIEAGVKFILEKIDFKNAKKSNTGDKSAATNTGDKSAATNTGDYSAATNTGNYSAATNTGSCSAATNTGNYSAATNTGNYSAATNTGSCSAATNTGNYSAATNTGNYSAATNTGDKSAATNTGFCSAATNTGNCSAATNTGNCSAATNTGNYSAAKVEGKDSIAIVTGYNSAAAGEIGCWLVLTERDDNYRITDVQAVRVDGEAIKANVFYKLVDGKILETEL